MNISVVLCTHNGENFLSPQLDSLARQTRHPDELVVCDDASRDNTMRQLMAYQEAAPFRVRLKRNMENLGFAQNFAQGLGIARGDLIFFADQDDAWDSEKIAKVAARFEADPGLRCFFSDSELVDDAFRPLGQTLFGVNGFTSQEQQQFRAGAAWKIFLRKNFVAGNALAIRVSAAEKAKLLPIPVGFPHDAWIISIFSLLGSVDFTTDRLLQYRQHGAQEIGTVAGGPWHRLRRRYRRALGQPIAGYERQAKIWRAILKRAQSLGEVAPLAAEAVEKKAAWLEERSRLPAFAPARLPWLFRQGGNYALFENGWASALKDFLAPHA